MTTLRKSFRLIPRAGCVALMFAVCALTSLAQSNKAELTGTVSDQNGAAIKDATVKISNPATGFLREVKTNSDGAYSAPSLDIGLYTVEVSAPGFKTEKRDEVKLSVGGTQALNVVLTPGEVSDVVTVTGETPLVQTETSERSAVISGREVTELPLSGRNFTELATLTPGVARAANAGVGGAGPDARQFNNGDPRAGNGGPGGTDARGDINIPVKAVQQIHEFGGTFGGPLPLPRFGEGGPALYKGKNRTFFFFDYLGQRNHIPYPISSTVPTARTRNGDFSEFLACGQIVRDPVTGVPFAGNIIPLSRQEPIARRILNLYPLPTANVACPSQGVNNYFTQRNVQERINDYGIKIEHRVSSKNSLTVRYNLQNLVNLRDNYFPTSVTGAPGLPTAGFGAGEENGDTRQLVVTDTHTFSPTVLNEFRFGLTKINIGINNCGVLGACGVSPTWANDIGIPNVNLGGPETSGGPGLGFTGNGFVEFLGDGGLFRAKSRNPYFADDVTIIRGNHVLKTGGELRMRLLNTVCGGCAGFEKGAIGFGDGGPGNNAQANALLNQVGFAQRSRTIGGPFDLRMQEWGFYVQDDFKVNDRLTLNLGLRYDILPGPTAPTEKDGRISYYFPDAKKVVVAGGSGDRLVSLDKNNFGPRVGFAWAANRSKTLVLRGGYGIVYTLDGVDYPPAVRNPPFTNIDFSNWTLSQGPPIIQNGIDPNNVPTGTNLFTVDRQQKNGMVHQFQLSVQKQFARNYSLDIGYVGNRSRNLLATFQEGSGGQGIALNAANQLIGGWQFNFIQSARSGFPFSVVCQCGLIRPSLVGDPFAGVARDRFLNPAAFSTSVGITSVTNAAGQTISFGNLGRNPFRGPAIWNTDLSFFKNTMVTEGLKFQLGIELFNAWNHTNLTVPNNNTGDPGAFGRFDGAYPGRVVQYRAKFIF